LAPQPQGELQQQEFIEHQTAATGLQMLLALRLVDAVAGVGKGQQLELAAQGGLQGIAPALDVGQNRAQHRGDPLLAQALTERVDRNDPADALGAHRRRGTLQHLDQRIPKGRAIGRLPHQTADRHVGAHRVLVLLES
jgi:hypothetical protein